MNELVSLRTEGDALVVQIHANELDMFMVPELREAVKTSLDGKPPVVIVRLGETDYMDSSALGFLFQLYRTVDQYGGRFCLIEVKDRINQLLTINGAQKYLKTYGTLPEALLGG